MRGVSKEGHRIRLHLTTDDQKRRMHRRYWNFIVTTASASARVRAANSPEWSWPLFSPLVSVTRAFEERPRFCRSTWTLCRHPGEMLSTGEPTSVLHPCHPFGLQGLFRSVGF